MKPLTISILLWGVVTLWLTRHGTVYVSTLGGTDASLPFVQQLDGRLDSADSLPLAARVRLAAILSADEGLRGLGTFAFIASHLLSAGGRRLSAVVEIICLIERLEEIRSEVQGIILSPHLATKLLYGL